ncbi:MAG: DEAD/DEAH box helicase family protein [Fibrobacter sp.]|uniref:DEAD/DEAH box helicase family protein n=1 Tax=Fibrobacter sp. TaxID=35828 RepID=UPI0025BFD873|nr:DEAD/DEAH box helicase family protein [Fibrobacter sp.]MBQ9224759.1 DEAD/DEAH box helicase family protein [Fibrobacter sp.]
MKSFTDIEWPRRYRSGDEKVKPRLFYNQVLPLTKFYRRAVGFFSSTCFLEISYGILELVKNDGKMQLITSPRLQEDDVKAIQKGYDARNIYLGALKRDMLLPQTIDEKNRLNVLANLIEQDILEIKIAVTEDPEDGMYHEKIGLFVDNEGNTIAISGSINESRTAISKNFESFQVFCDWKPDYKERVEDCINDFDDMWNDKQVDLKIFDFPELPKEFIQTYKTSTLSKDKLKKEKDEPLSIEKKEDSSEEIENSPLFFIFPKEIQPRPYQKEAIANFINNNYKSLFAMATGTGKTLTSLFAANELCCHKKIDSILIIVPLKDLVDQWEKDIRKFFTGQVVTIRSGIEWKEKISELSILKILDCREKLIVITTYDSFASNDFKILSAAGQNSLIIADEVHKFGATTYSQKLPESIPYRIGLSATPKRAYDEKGTAAVFDFFCPSENPYVFGIKEAIDAEMLCHYNYYPIIVKLSEPEMELYESISEKISRMATFSSDSDERNDLLQQMLKKRHRIIEKAKNKKEAFLNLMEKELEKYTDKTIVFCPDGVDDQGRDELTNYKTELWNRMREKGKFILMSEYVQGTEKKVLDAFAVGSVNIVFAKQRLNEGIDIPAAKRAVFIASSTSEREFIQRRGRVLRIAPGKKLAEIFDFIVVPPDESSEHKSSILNNEINRAIDFARTADNYEEIEFILRKYL